MEKVIYLDDQDNPTSKEKATRVRIIIYEKGKRVREVYGVLEPKKS